MDRTFSKRRYLVSTLVAAGGLALVPACTHQDLPPGLDEPVQVAARAPKPISGGTLLVTSKGLAVAADSDRDLVWMVDLNTHGARQVQLKQDDEPGRVVEDAAGRVHVALRGGGAVATIDLASGTVVDRTEVCAAPRGIAFDAKSDEIHVACAGGELVTLPAAGGEATRVLHLDRDLRDVIVSGNQLIVSRFKSAQLLVLDADSGAVLSRKAPPILDPGKGFDKGGPGEFSGIPAFEPGVAWRTVPLAGHGFAMAHQRGLLTPVVISQPDGYGSSGGGCDGSIDHSTVTIFGEDGSPSTIPAPALPPSVLPVDVASDGNKVAVVAAGSDLVFVTSSDNLAQEASGDFVSCSTMHSTAAVPGEPVAVGFFKGNVVVQTRQPAGIRVLDGSTPIMLPGVDMSDTGHDLFHRAASETTGLACASCHPEGHEDGRTWHFDLIGARRTQEVGNDVLQTAPLHWDGDMTDLGAIMTEVFVHRMGGSPQGERHLDAFSHWMSSMPKVKISATTASVKSIEHGQALFNDAAVGCATCHTGARFTNNSTMDVGTGKAFQVPSLAGIAARAPFMHDGCAPTLKDRFGACGGGDKHGKTSQLSGADIDDLVAYLETL